ncbi:MAG TPA: formylglycine-generating enzyme family protein [Burkholderiaceae bacterium]|nr:formylglycine-generating enzyme family protein [Burkholderiaceae bacterium]
MAIRMGRARLRAAAIGAASVLGVAGVPASAAPAYVALPGGTFESVLPQGNSPTASTPVDVARFALRVEPVTAAEFLAFVVTHPEWRRGAAPEVFVDARYLADWRSPLQLASLAGADRPVTNVSWFAARAFCESEGARLPTWLEWEYAAAADETRRDARSDPQWRQRILTWYEQPASAGLPAVGGAPNAYGVRDLHGVVWEWVEDFNALFIAGDSRTQGDPDLLKFCGAGAISVLDRDSYAVLMRIALLSSLVAADTTASLGFRCARSIPEKP